VIKETLLITGGSGYLGRQLALMLKDRYRVILASRNNGINQIAERMTGCESAPLDVSQVTSVSDVFAEFRPSIVIHAAATKYVDVSEKFPYECIDVNVVGSENIARASIEHNVKAVIGVSTDKAAPPVGNIYGHSKAMMERLYTALDGRNGTRFTCVRFGNITWSTGSIFPIWEKMSQENKMVQSTGPHMRRFFFSVQEAAELVIAAKDNIGLTGGAVLSRMMKSALIEDVLNVWKEVYQVSWEKIDPRPGDKIDEYLVGEIEVPNTEKIELDGKAHLLLRFNKKPVGVGISKAISSENAERLSSDEIRNLILNKPLPMQ